MSFFLFYRPLDPTPRVVATWSSMLPAVGGAGAELLASLEADACETGHEGDRSPKPLAGPSWFRLQPNSISNTPIRGQRGKPPDQA